MKNLVLFLGIVCSLNAYSQQYTVSTIPYAALPDTGTSILTQDDMFSAILPLGFNFCFYGNIYDSCVVGTNGVITFDTSYANLSCPWVFPAVPIPSPTNLRNTIFGPYHDMYVNNINMVRYYTVGNPPNRKFVVSFDSIPLYGCLTSYCTQQMILNEGSNIIEMHLLNKPNCSGWNGGATVQGVQNSTGSQAVAIPGRNANPFSTSNDGRRFTPTFTSCYVGIGEEENNFDINIYPNPSNGIFTVETGGLIDQGIIVVYNQLGEIIMETTLSSDKSKIDLTAQPKGLYLYTIHAAGKMISKGKLIFE